MFGAAQQVRGEAIDWAPHRQAGRSAWSAGERRSTGALGARAAQRAQQGGGSREHSRANSVKTHTVKSDI